MTMLEKAVSKKALAKLDRFRLERGLRTRRQALELLLAETVPMEEAETIEHPLFARLRAAPKVAKGSVSPKMIAQIQTARKSKQPALSLEDVRAELNKKRSKRAA
jgi:hypothetical protein